MPCLYLQSPCLHSLALQPTEPHGALASHLVVACTSAWRGPPPRSVWPESGAGPQRCLSPPFPGSPYAAPCHGSGSVPAGSGGLRAQTAPGAGSGRSKLRRNWPYQVRPPFPATPPPILDPLGVGGGRELCTPPPDPRRERRGQRAQSQEGPPGKDDRLPMGTGLQGLLQAGILQARNNCLRATAQLPGA